MQERPKLLLVGGEGFIGRNLASFFSEIYDCASVGVEKSLFCERNDTFLKKDPYREKITQRYHSIVHLIDNAVVIEEFMEGEKRLMENIPIDSCCHLVVFSSAVVYVNPDSPYGQRKRMLEDFYTRYCKEHNIHLTIFRLFNTFGAFQIPFRQGSLIANLFYNFLNKKSTEINDMSAKRDFVYAGDIPKFVHYALKNQLLGTHDLASGKLISIGEVVTFLEKNILKESLNIIDKKNKENTVCPHAKGTIAQSIAILPFAEGLKRAFDFYTANMQIIKQYVD